MQDKEEDLDLDLPDFHMPQDEFQRKDAYLRWLAAKKAGKPFQRFNVGRLKDDDGNRFPAPAQPFIFVGGNGRPDEPPVGAASYTTNRRKVIAQVAK